MAEADGGINAILANLKKMWYDYIKISSLET